MSLPQNQREELFTADKELPDFLPADDPMVVFSKEIYPAFKDEDFAQYYSSKGRWATSPAFLACVTILQFRENLSDPEAAEACVRRLDWKIALHLPVTEKTSFHPSTLCYYRRRLKENKAMSVILDKTVKLAQQKGFIQKRTHQRVDATHIICHVNRICTTDLLFRAVKCLVEEIEKKDPHYYEQELPQYIRERYSQRFSSFGMSRNIREEKLSEIVEDGLLIKTLLERIPSCSLSGSEQLPIMETIFRENVVIKKKEIEGKIFVQAQEIQSPRQTIFDPRDRSIRLGKKANKSWVGSKCHVVETAQKGKVNFITNMIYQQAHEHDAYVHKELREDNERRDLRPEKVFADMGYINGSAICEYRKHGQELMGYMQAESSKKPEAFKIQRFSIDMERKKALCPAGQESLKAQIGKEGEIKMPFSKSACPVCSFFRDCVGERKGKMRILTVRPWYEFVRERREIQETETFREEMKVRAQVEGTISEGTRFLGLRRAKYKGEDGHRIQFYMTGAALNVKRLAKAITQGIEIQRKPVPVFAS
jgi:IS5 family transposase